MLVPLPKEHGVVEGRELTFAGRGQPIQKVGELLGEITVVLGPVFLAVGVGKLVMSFAADAQNRREAIADAHAVFGADLVGRHAGVVGLQRGRSGRTWCEYSPSARSERRRG